MTEQESRRGKSRRERVEFARSRDILDVANELQMELVRSGRDYRWKEHDSLVISPDKNLWKWFSRNTGGDAISLVETIKEVDFNQSVDFLNDGNFKEFQMVERPQEDFKYYLEKYEQPFSDGRDYLRTQRGLSDETIDYFLEQGVLAQANAKLDYFAEGNSGSSTKAIEPVIVFKSLSSSGEVVGASLQGIQENWEKWPKHGYAKVIMKNSDPMTGIHVDIGSPKRLIFTESPIDLMSYYELHKDSLQDVRLVSMDGLKESTIGRHLSQIQAEISGKPLRWTPEQMADGLQIAIDHHFFEDGKNADLITLALDNDKAGRTFIQELEAKGAVINSDLPELRPGQDKTDWNDVLKNQQEEKPDNSRLAQARRKLERLKGEQDDAISRAYSHQALTNGQPMNDKRGGASFMRKQEQIEGQVFSKMDEIRQQEEQQNVEESVRPVIVLNQDELYSDYWHVYQSDGELEFYLFEDGQFGYRQYGSLSQKEDDIVFKYHSEPGKTEFLATQMGYDSLKYIVVKDWESLFDENKALLRENYVFDDLENFLKKSNYFELDYWTFNSGLKEDEEFLNEITKKAHDQNQELSNNTGGELFNRSSSFLGEDSPGTAPQPVEQIAQPDFPTNVPLYFNIDRGIKSNFRLRKGYYYPKNKDIRNITAYASDIQNSATWYLNELADTTVTYFYKDGAKQQALQVKFEKRHWMHLTGLAPIYSEKLNSVAETFIDEISSGHTNFQNITVGPGYLDKIQILPMLSEVLETDSFVFDDLSFIEKFGRLDAESAIRSEDKNIILAFQTDSQDEMFPASLLKPGLDLNIQMDTLSQEKTILGVLIEKDGEIRVHRINTDYIKDNGAEMLSILKNKQYEEVSKELKPLAPENTLNKTSLDSATFTQVLDTVYNLGVPGDISKTPEEFHQSWNQYLNYAKKYNDKFDQIVAAAGEDHLLDTNSDFYKEWIQDHIYKENYHVRLQWSEERPEGPILPFKETDLISYQDFARELYKANQDFYPIHQEGMKQVTAGNTEGYIPPTKIKFDIYAPGGEVIKEGIRYDIGDETRPISQMLGLGYRRLNGQSELASMDEEILSQLENREVNKEISQEANESTRLTEEVTGQTLDTRETVAFQSSKQETKNNLLQRVEEILKEEPISNLETPEVNSSSIDYATLTPHELSEVAFQKVREYTETPERLEEYLNFMSKFPELSPRNVALIQEQWPGANAVATYNQWQSMGEALRITSDQVFETRNTYTNKKTGRTREVVHNNLSVKTGEKSHITLFRPMMVEMIPVLDENGNQVKNGKGNPKYKRLSEATPEEKALKKEGKLKSRFFQERDSNTGLAKFATYKVFELSQTTLKPEFYPKAMPNRHYDFNMDHIRTKEVLEGLSDYAKGIGVTIYQDDAKELKSAKGAFYPDEQKILLNPDNTPGEVVATTIHELAHASLHNPKFANSYKEDVSKDRRELEAEMTSYLVSKHFGLDTSEKAIRYMAIWTDNLTSLDDQQLAQSMKRIHGTVSKIVKSVEQHTKPYQLNRQVVQNQNFIQSPKKGLKI